MKIVAIGLSHNEADVIRECVTDALTWVDAFVLYDSSTDGTADLARAAGALVLPGNPNEQFSEYLRQNTLKRAAVLNPDWIVRIDPDEFYPHGIGFLGWSPQDPRKRLETLIEEGYLAARAHVVQFWICNDDIKRGLLLEDETVSVQMRRKWYTVGHTAVVAWKHSPELAYRDGAVKNIPFYLDGCDVGQVRCSSPALIQTHYPCRSLRQLVARVEHRKQYKTAFGKYQHNLIIDETVGLHHWFGGAFCTKTNHQVVYDWFDASMRMYKERAAKEFK